MTQAQVYYNGRYWPLILTDFHARKPNHGREPSVVNFTFLRTKDTIYFENDIRHAHRQDLIIQGSDAEWDMRDLTCTSLYVTTDDNDDLVCKVTLEVGTILLRELKKLLTPVEEYLAL